MTLQAILALALVLLAALYFCRGTLRSALGGGCASGCGSCKSSTCPVQTLKPKLDGSKPKPQLP